MTTRTLSDLSTDELHGAGCRTVRRRDWEPMFVELDGLVVADGLPLRAATREAVEDVLQRSGRTHDDVVGVVAGRDQPVTLLQVAACAVMAGADPAWFPVVLASVEAMTDPEFNLAGVLTSSGGAGLTGVVCGPVVERMGLNAGSGLLGPGNRPNATIGRSLRLLAMLVLGAHTSELDASSFGHGGKYSGHFAEDPTTEDDLGSLRVREGVADGSTVTMIATDGPRQVFHAVADDPEVLLNKLASAMSDPSHFGSGRDTTQLVVLGPEHRRLLAAHFAASEIMEELSDRSCLPPERLERLGIDVAGDPGFVAAGGGRLLTVRPDHVVLTGAGGWGAGWSVVLPGWGSRSHTHHVTKRIDDDR